MANIKNKFSQPLSTEFTPKDLVVDIKNGHLYYKSNLGVHKLVGDNLSTDTEEGDIWQSGASDALYYNGGNVGIGTTTPGETLEIVGNISASGNIHVSSISASGDIHGSMFISSGSSNDEGGQLTLLPKSGGDYTYHIDNYQENFRIFAQSASQADVRFHMSSSGNVGIGATPSEYKFYVQDSNSSGEMIKFENTSTNSNARILDLKFGAAAPDGLNRYINFRKGNNGVVGFISGDGSGVSFDETSDIRLKKEISPTKYGIGNLMGIEIVEYKYKDNNNFRTGIIAQQAIDYYPPAVKDYEEYNIEQELTPEDKEYEYMTVAYQKYIPLLMKSVQDSHTKILELEEKIKKLENGSI